MKRNLSWLMVIWPLVFCLTSIAEEGKWVKKADMPTPKIDFATCSVNGKIYVIGGYNNIDKFLSTVEEYNPHTDTWAKKADMPTKRAALAASAVNNRIYAIGGTNNWYGMSLSTVEEYDPVADKWIKKSDMPTARDGLGTGVINGKIYAIGGGSNGSSSSPIFSIVEEYDPATDKWSKKSDMPTARNCFANGTVNGKIYIIGGVVNWVNPWTATVEEYNPVTDTWTRKASMFEPKAFMGGAEASEKIYVCGGLLENKTRIPTFDEYDPVKDRWTRRIDMPASRGELFACGIDGKIYAMGGRDSHGKYLSLVEEIDTGSLPVGVEPKGKLATTWSMLKFGN